MTPESAAQIQDRPLKPLLNQVGHLLLCRMVVPVRVQLSVIRAECSDEPGLAGI